MPLLDASSVPEYLVGCSSQKSNWTNTKIGREHEAGSLIERW
jgi:hypothetical protein